MKSIWLFCFALIFLSSCLGTSKGDRAGAIIDDLTAASATGVVMERKNATTTPLMNITQPGGDLAAESPTPTPAKIEKLTGECENPLLPLREGATWKYRVSNPRGDFLYSLHALKIERGNNLTMLLRFDDEHNGVTIEEPVVCSHGALENFPNYFMDMLFADQIEKHLNTVHMEEPSYPAFDVFEASGWKLNWHSLYLTEDLARVQGPLREVQLLISRSSELELNYEMDGTMEQVSVPAGDFEAFKVRHTFEFLVTIPSAYTNSAAGVLTVEVTQWYAPNVGLVKSELVKATIRSSGLEAGVPLEGVCELVSIE